ncbi:MAG: hypothetical protein VXZ39_07015 [Planctomycetota bacterium]|nr:hypothetical protein [Planctomycetota bacterium]MEC8513158.1 hypothetical protein [Planctomycetota bacterium]
MAFYLFIRPEGRGAATEHDAWIDRDEEWFLDVVARSGLRCPVLQRIHGQYYRSPRIHPEDCARALAELERADPLLRDHRAAGIDPESWPRVQGRLRILFETAVRLGRRVDTHSD